MKYHPGTLHAASIDCGGTAPGCRAHKARDQGLFFFFFFFFKSISTSGALIACTCRRFLWLKLRDIIFQTILHQLAKNVLSKKSEPRLSQHTVASHLWPELGYDLACLIWTSRSPEPHHKVIIGPGERQYAILQANSPFSSHIWARMAGRCLW